VPIAAKPLKVPKQPSKRVKRGASSQPSAAAVARSVIQHLDEQTEVAPKAKP
jgi:hypothetical protein